MQDLEKRNLVAQWAFDIRPVLLRFHLWLEDVDVEWEGGVPAEEDYSFVPRGIRRCLAMASAVTAMGTYVFGGFGDGKSADKKQRNFAKKSADALAAYVLSEALWHTTRNLPENHAIMVSLGEGLMPKAGETPEMGANPMLGFGRVYARPEVAKFVDRQVHRLLNDPSRTFDDFYAATKHRGITIWGAAIDTLENTTRFAKGDSTGPMSVLHLFDQPLAVSRPYESYMGSLTVPRAVAETAEDHAILLDMHTPRAKVVEAIEQTYPGIERGNIHVWTLRGDSRRHRIGTLWAAWQEMGVHLVEDGWVTPAGGPAFCDSGTYAPTYMVGDWTDADGVQHVFLCDGYAASAEAMQAASLSEALDVDVSMALYSPWFKLPYQDEYQLMRLDPADPAFDAKASAIAGANVEPAQIAMFKDAIDEAQVSNVAVGKRILRADDFFPEKRWRVLACTGMMCDDPYTGAEGVTDLGDGAYRVDTRLVTRQVNVKCTLTFRLQETLEQSRLVFSPLLIRLISRPDFRQRPVKVSDSGRIRNELQTLMSQALEYEGEIIRVHFDRVDDQVLVAARMDEIRAVLEWYKDHHPMWFDWLEIV